MTLKFTLLGCGASPGVPSIGNHWGKCDPENPKNKRRRACALLQSDTTTLVIDTGTDFREQMNDMNIKHIDHVVYTHAHSDHIQGIDDLRLLRIRSGHPVDIYSLEPTIKELKHRFSYLFQDNDVYDIYPKILEPHIWTQDQLNKPMSLGDIEFTPFIQDHGPCDTLGFRFGNLGYSTDMVQISDENLELLKNVDIWIADGGGNHQTDHMTHAPLSRIDEMNKIVQAKTVYVTVLSVFMDYTKLSKELPDGFKPAYDGVSFEISY